MPGPLAGVRVLDLTGVVSGPFATMFLADQGADVIKIEPISGDITRRSRAPIDKGGEFSALFISSNRGKRSLAIDIKSEAGVEVLRKLVGQADVLVQNFRPGTMERLGLGPDELLAQQPRLIYVSISGVGETGPYAKKRVYDPIVQGLSGFADIQAQPVTNRPQMIRTIVADKTTAIVTAQAVSSALYAREKTGRGDHIRVAMLDAMLSYLWPEGMSQYTVIDDGGKAPDPNDRPDLVFNLCESMESDARNEPTLAGLFDLFGIRFDNHPGLRRLLLPEDADFHPLRKDFGKVHAFRSVKEIYDEPAA